MFASIWKKLLGPGEEESLPENRKFHRVLVSESALLELELPNGETVILNDISFGGMSVPLHESLQDTKISAVLRVLDLSYRCRLSEAHRSDKHIGYLFEEGNESVLVFLQPIMNALHQGSSLQGIDPSVLKEEKQRFHLVLRGDGPVDILIESSKDATLNCLMTFRKDKAYRQINWRDGIISTGKLLDERGVAPRMNPDKDPDRVTLKQAMLILAGGLEQQELRKPLKSLLTSLQNLYYKQR